MKLLILTSELLNPRNVLSSTFELTQARILSEKFDVAILSVSAVDSLSAAVKAFIRKLLFIDRQAPGMETFKRLVNATSGVIFRKKTVSKYKIEGIDVYEGVACAAVSSADFGKQVDVWVEAGRNAFDAYCSDRGRPTIIHAHGRFLYAGALALHLQRNHGIKYVYTEHSTYFRRGIAPAASKPILNAIIDNAAAYIVVSRALLDDVELFLGRAIDKARVIPNALDTIFEEPVNDKRPVYDHHFVFINIASLEEKKGHEVLIRAFHQAFAKDKRYSLYICGDGPLESKLIALRDELGLSGNIFFTGRKTKQEVKELLDGAHVFVLSSLVETFGVVIIEALSRGCPVVATRCGGPEYLLDDSCGLLIEPGSIEQLSGAFRKMVVDYPGYDSHSIRQHAIDKYGAAVFLNTMSLLYKSFEA